MSTTRPVVFDRTTLLDVSDQALEMRIPRGPSSVWFLVIGGVLACAAPAVLLYLQARGAPDLWLILTVVLGGMVVMLPWNVIERVALSWSRLARASGHLALRRADDGTYILTINGRVEARSHRRGLFFVDHQGVKVLALVIGDRVTNIASYVQTGATGIDWSFSEWDKARAELARGADPLADTWPARSVVPLVRAVSEILRLGPQAPISLSRLGCKDQLMTLVWVLALPVLHMFALRWVQAHPNVGEPLPLLARGLLIGALAVLPDGWILYRHLKRAWLDPFNRQADEILNRAQSASREAM